MSSPKLAAKSGQELLTSSLEEFGVDSLDVESILRTALSHGGALAELFFERTASTRVVYEGGRVDKVTDGTDGGVGVRIIFDNKSVYGYTTELTQESVQRLAQTLSEAVTMPVTSKNQKTAALTFDWRYSRTAQKDISQYQIVSSPRNATLAEKIKLAERGDQGARK